jgi:hypothetical protein
MASSGGGSAPHAPKRGVYANYFEIGDNAFEIVIDFGQHYESEQGPVECHTRIVMTPGGAKSLLQLLQQTIAAHEAEYGPIRTP